MAGNNISIQIVVGAVISSEGLSCVKLALDNVINGSMWWKIDGLETDAATFPFLESQTTRPLKTCSRLLCNYIL